MQPEPPHLRPARQRATHRRATGSADHLGDSHGLGVTRSLHVKPKLGVERGHEHARVKEHDLAAAAQVEQAHGNLVLGRDELDRRPGGRSSGHRSGRAAQHPARMSHESSLVGNGLRHRPSTNKKSVRLRAAVNLLAGIRV
jgi:hypothetical protein